MQVISRNEFERIKASIVPISADERSRLARREELKKLSEDKKSKWPNTLEAVRKKKESFLKDKEEREELRRQEIDRQVRTPCCGWGGIDAVPVPGGVTIPQPLLVTPLAGS
jgi:hypothetical protein